MEGKSLKKFEKDTTFFNKISHTLTKLLIPTKVGFNSVIINLKRNVMIKAYENYCELKDTESSKTKNALNKYEESYTLYLETIDKYIMDSVYKKVKNGNASEYEKRALSEYYNVVHIKEKDYNEYKSRKQKFLLELDYENIINNSKEKLIIKYRKMYLERVDELYKQLFKNYSIKLADGVKSQNASQIDNYKNIFSTLDEYVKKVLPIKIEEGFKDLEKIRYEYGGLDRFDVGILDEKDFLEKNTLLIAISRTLFTHSLPMVAAENCYNKLINDARKLIVVTTDSMSKDDVYKVLLKIISSFNEKILSTKVYWENQKQRDEYKKFTSVFNNAKNQDEKEIAIIRKELVDINDKDEKVYDELRKFYKLKLVEFGVMKNLKNSCNTIEFVRFRSNKKVKGMEKIGKVC